MLQLCVTCCLRCFTLLFAFGSLLCVACWLLFVAVNSWVVGFVCYLMVVVCCLVCLC